MRSRNFVLILAAALVAVVVFAFYQRSDNTPSQHPKVVIYTLLSHPILDESIAGIREGLASSGYPDGSLEIRVVNANGQFDLLSSFAKEVLANKPRVVVPVSTPVTQAIMQEASQSQDIVFSTVTNPADVGMEKHPANATGVSDAVNYEANVQLIRELLPQAKKIGIIYNPGERNSQFGVEQVKPIAAKHGFTLTLVAATNSNEVANAARSLLETVDVIYVGSDNTVVGAIESVVAVANERKIPVVASDVGSVEKGALAAVSVNYRKLGNRVGAIVAEVLRSNKRPGQIPNEFFYGDELIINKREAALIAFEFPKSVLDRNPRATEKK